MGERNHLFDGLRGTAALLGVGMHAAPRTEANWVPGGNLAVDFFFLLSGFVIAHAYERQLLAGMTLASFASLRVARLYPVYAMGVALGIAGLLRDHIDFPMRASGSAIVAASGFNAVMLPAPFGFEALFPTNFVAWSLFAEMVVNVLYGAVLFRLRSCWLWLIVGICGVAIVDHAVHFGGIAGGWTGDTVAIGIARGLFSFTLGVLIARRRRDRALTTSWLAYLLPMLLVAALMVPVAASLRPVVDLALVFGAFPLVIIYGAATDIPPLGRRLFALAGLVSYPLYSLHIGVLRTQNVMTQVLEIPSITAALIGASLALAVATVVAVAIEPPARRWLSRLVLRPG